MKKNTKKSILVLGAGVMQLPALRIARREGWHLIVTDANPRALGKDLAHDFENADLKDKQAILAVARKYKKTTGLDGIFTCGTDFSTTVAYVAEKLGLPGIPYKVACRATDKALMRRCFHQAGVPSPRFVSLNQNHKPQNVLEKLDFPLVIKPVDNMGARGVRRVDNMEQLETGFAQALQSSRSGQVVAEEYMAGTELSLDAIIFQNNITLCGIADRHICFEPYFVEMGHTMPTKLSKQKIARILNVFFRGIRALGIDSGAAKGDIKVTPRGVMIGEIAARLSGGYMSGWTYPYASGVEPTKAGMLIAMGLPPSALEPRFNKHSAERAFISIPGIVEQISGIEQAGQISGIRNTFLRVKPGDRVQFPTNNIQKCGNFISQADTRLRAINTAEQAVRSILIRLKPGVKKTDSFLFDNNSGQVPAYQFSDRLNQEIRAMPLFSNHQYLQKNNKIAVLKPVHLNGQNPVDWHGMPVHTAIKRAIKLSGIKICHKSPTNMLVLGRLFWRALQKGGLQGVLYVIDTINAVAKSSSKHIKNILGGWAHEL